MTITEVAEQYGLSTDTLRYYERIGLIPPVRRGKRGIRDYDETDCDWVQFIKCMRSTGIPIEALIEFVSLFQQGKPTQELKAILLEQRERLVARIVEMQETLAKLDHKIAGYDNTVLAAENKLL
jgi:DNA-binding transcriptional MerR regulator